MNHHLRLTTARPRSAAIAFAIAATLGLAGCDRRAPQAPAPSVSTAAPVAAPVATVPTQTTAPTAYGQPVPQMAPAVAAATPVAPAYTPAQSVATAPVYAPPAASPVPAYAPPQQAVAPIPMPMSAPRVAQAAPMARVVSIEPIRERPRTTGAGAVVGGLLGAVVGNHFGHGGGRAAMTVLGAGGGALAGNTVEGNIHERVVAYSVRVQLASGASRTYQETSLDGLRVGDRVRIEGHRLRPV